LEYFGNGPLVSEFQEDREPVIAKANVLENYKHGLGMGELERIW
jgi:hypothetical protein